MISQLTGAYNVAHDMSEPQAIETHGYSYWQCQLLCRFFYIKLFSNPQITIYLCLPWEAFSLDYEITT